MADVALITSGQLTDEILRRLNAQNEQNITDEEALEGVVVDEFPRVSSSANPALSDTPEKELRARIEAGEWDNMDDLPAFKNRTPEGQLMARIEAIDNRIRQLELRLPMLLNQYLHDAYVQVLRKINALRKTKAALFYFFYKNSGQRDLPGS